MKALIYIYTLMLLAACSPNQQGDPTTESQPIEVDISTRALLGQTVQGVTISSLRLIIINSGGDYVVFNKTTLDGGLTDQSLQADKGHFLATLYPDTYQFYVIANETSAMTPQLAAATNRNSISGIKVQGTFTDANMVMFDTKKALIRPSSNATVAEVLVQGSSDWTPTLPISLGRVGVKISLAINKKTTPEVLIVKKVDVVQAPSYCFLGGQSYDGALNGTSSIYNSPTGVTFTTNDPGFTAIGSSVIIPEYILTNQSAANAAILQIGATFNGVDVVYKIPLRGNYLVENYSLLRNDHYQISVTITKPGDINYTPYVEYTVADWDDAMGTDINVGGTPTFTGSWSSSTTIVNTTTVGVYNNGYVEYSFALTAPSGARWAATLSNGLDFGFDYTGGAVSSGIAGGVHIIRIKPLRTVMVAGVQTQFYITVNNISSIVEPQLTGSATRYVVTQIPN